MAYHPVYREQTSSSMKAINIGNVDLERQAVELPQPIGPRPGAPNALSQPEIWGSGKPREESLRTRSPPWSPSSHP